MRTANKQTQVTNPINERRNYKSNAKNLSKSPLRQKQVNNNNNQNQYAVIEQAKRDFYRIERGDYSSNKRNFSKENYNSKNSKNSDYEIPKEESENRPLAVNHINAYVSKKIENDNNNRSNNSKEKIQNYSYKLPMRNTHFVPGNGNYIQGPGTNDSNKEKHSSIPRMQNNIQQNRNKRNTGYVNNIGIKTKEYFANEVDIEIKNFQANTGKNITSSLTYNLNKNSNCESRNRQNEKESHSNNLLRNVNTSNNIPNYNGIKYNTNTTKNKQVNSRIDSTYVFSENINHKNLNNFDNTEEKFIYSNVNVIIPNNANVNYNNLYELKDVNSKTNSDPEKNKELNSKIKLLVDKIKEKKSYESENQIPESKPKKPRNLNTVTENNNYNKYDFPLQISPSIRSKEFSSVIADLQSKNAQLSNQLSSFREKLIDPDCLKNEALKTRKEKNKSKSSQKSFGIAPVSHDKKKSFDNNSNKSSSHNASFVRNNHHKKQHNITNINFNKSKNLYFENSDKKSSKEKSLNFYSHNDTKTVSNFNKFNKSNIESNNQKEYFNYLKDEANYNKQHSLNVNDKKDEDRIYQFKETESQSAGKTKCKISKINSLQSNFVYESMKIPNTKYIIAENKPSNDNKNNFEETVKINSIKNLNTNPEVLLSWNAFGNTSNVPKSPLRRLQDKVNEKDKEISDLELKLKQANYSATVNEKNASKAERKVESLQKIISEILSKNKADLGTIEKLREEVGKLSRDGDFVSNYNNNINHNANKIFKNFNSEEIILHKIYSNFSETLNADSKENNEKQNNKLQNTFYFVLISDAAQQNFVWIDLTNIAKTLNPNNEQSNSQYKAFLNKNSNESYSQEQIQILEAISFYSILANKNNNNTEEKKEKESNKQNKKTLSPGKSIKQHPNIIENLANSSLQKPQNFKNFSAASIPLQNLYSIEAEIVSVYADYLGLEHEFSKSKNLFTEEIMQKDAIISKLRQDLEKLIDDNGRFLQGANALKSELADKQNNLINLDSLNKEKDALIAELHNEVNEMKEKFEISFENRKGLEARISELQGIVMEKSKVEKKLLKEKENFETQLKQVTLELVEGKKIICEKDLLIEKFSGQLGELDAKYKASFAKVEFVEKNELLASIEVSNSANNNINKNDFNNQILNSNNNFNNKCNNIGGEEKTNMLSKIHELELLKNSYLDKISILEFINKNFENEKTEKEKQIDELTLKLTELQRHFESLAEENNVNLTKLADTESQLAKSLAEVSIFKASKEEEFESLKKMNNELEQKLNANYEEISSLNNTLAIRNVNASNFEKEIKELKKEIKEAKIIADEKALNLAAAGKKILDLENQIRFNFEKFDEEKSKLRDDMNTKLNNLLMEKSDILVKYQGLLEEFNKYQQNCEKLKTQHEENLKKLKAENKKLKINLSELTNKSEMKNKELEDLLLEYDIQVENSAKMQKELLEAESQLKKLDALFIKQEELTGKLNLEKEELTKQLESEKNKNINFTSTNNNSSNVHFNSQANNKINENLNKKSDTNNNTENLNKRILELQKINIQLEQDIKEKSSKIDSLEADKLLISKKLNEAKETNEKNFVIINEKNKKLIADDFTIKDLSRKLNDLEIDLKNSEDENLQYKTKLNELQKDLNFLKENPNQQNKINSKSNDNIAELECKIKLLSDENRKLKDELENARNQCERLIDELNENNILKLDPNLTKRGDEVNVTLYGNNEIYKTNLNNSLHLNNSNSILDLNNTNNCININSTNALTNSTGNNNFINGNKSNNILLSSNRKEKDDNNINHNNNNEYMLKIMDYEDKLEKLIFSNSELARKNNSLTIEIKTLQERIYALENFEEPEINKKLKQMKKQNEEKSSSLLNPQKDLVEIQIENERLQELIKDYELSISELQNKLELQYNEINRLRDEYEDEIANTKKKEVENFSFFANDKTERANNNNNQTFCNNNNNFNNVTFFDSNENDCRISNIRLSNEDHFKKLNAELIEKNKLIEKLTKELNDSYALMGEANKKLEIFEVDYLNKSK